MSITSPDKRRKKTHSSNLTLTCICSPVGVITSSETSIIFKAMSAIWTACMSLSLCKPPATQYASPIVSTWTQRMITEVISNLRQRKNFKSCLCSIVLELKDLLISESMQDEFLHFIKAIKTIPLELNYSCEEDIHLSSSKIRHALHLIGEDKGQETQG